LLLPLFELHLFTRKETKTGSLAMVIDQFFERMYQVASTGIIFAGETYAHFLWQSTEDECD